MFWSKKYNVFASKNVVEWKYKVAENGNTMEVNATCDIQPL